MDSYFRATRETYGFQGILVFPDYQSFPKPGKEVEAETQRLSPSFTLLVKVLQLTRLKHLMSPKHFGRNWLCSNHGRKAPEKWSPRRAVWNYVSVSQSKQASTHSLKGSWLDHKCVLTSGGKKWEPFPCMNRSHLLQFRIDSLSWQPPVCGHEIKNGIISAEIDLRLNAPIRMWQSAPALPFSASPFTFSTTLRVNFQILHYFTTRFTLSHIEADIVLFFYLACFTGLFSHGCHSDRNPVCLCQLLIHRLHLLTFQDGEELELLSADRDWKVGRKSVSGQTRRNKHQYTTKYNFKSILS